MFILLRKYMQKMNKIEKKYLPEYSVLKIISILKMKAAISSETFLINALNYIASHFSITSPCELRASKEYLQRTLSNLCLKRQ
jgi:hypothetical protein